VPTPVGQSCLGSAERVLSEVINMRVAASGKAILDAIRVGMVEKHRANVVSNFLARIEGRYPKVQMEIDVNLSNRSITMLARRQIDIALLPGPVQLPGVVRVSLGDCVTEVVGTSALCLKDREMKAADLAELPIIGMPQDANAYHSIINRFERPGSVPALCIVATASRSSSAGAMGSRCQSAAVGLRRRPRVTRLKDIHRTASKV
jgi:DNA-binding transcriptional LysR family regulator